MTAAVTTTKTGGEALVQGLLAHGFRTVYGLPGIQNDWLYNALYDHRDEIAVVHTRHEQGAAYMALGAALATGQPALASVVPGPGVLNAGAALATAFGLNAPLLLLAGQIPRALEGRGTGALHEIDDQLGLLKRLSKLALRIDDPAKIPAMLHDAVLALRSGRPRPVAIEVPMDVLAKREAIPGAHVPVTPQFPALDGAALQRLAETLAGAQRPLIFVGSGALGVSAQVRELAELLGAPVVSYRTGRGIVDSRSPLSVVLPAARPLWARADVVLALGTTLRMPLQGWEQDPARQVLRIDVDPATHALIRAPHQALTARLEDALPPLLALLRAMPRHAESRSAELAALHADWNQRVAVLQPQIGYLEVIRQVLGERGVFVDELTQVGFASRLVYPVYAPRTFLSTGYMGTLGYGFPTALGAKHARPELPVISVTGDGGFMFAATELATAVQHRIGLVTVLFNNGQYGNVQQMQREQYGGRVIATDLVNPDFVALATAFGARAFRATTPAALGTALEAALAGDGPALVEVPCGDMPSVDRFR